MDSAGTSQGRTIEPVRSFVKFGDLKNYYKSSFKNNKIPVFNKIHLTIPWTYEGSTDQLIIEVIQLNKSSLQTLNVKYYECGLIHLLSILSVNAPKLNQLSINCYGPGINLPPQLELEHLPSLTRLTISFSPFKHLYYTFREALIKLFNALPNLEFLAYSRNGSLKYQNWFHDFVIEEMSNLLLCPKLKEFQTPIIEFTQDQLLSLVEKKKLIKKLCLHFNPQNPKQVFVEKKFVTEFLQRLSTAKTLTFLELDWKLDNNTDGIFPISQHSFETCLLSLSLKSWNSSLGFLQSLISLKELSISFTKHTTKFAYSIYKENQITKLSVDNWKFSSEELNKFLKCFPSLMELRICLSPIINNVQEIQASSLIFNTTLTVLELNNWNGENYEFLLNFVHLRTLIIRLLPTVTNSKRPTLRFPQELPNLHNTLKELILSQFNSSLEFIKNFSTLEQLWLTFNDFDNGIFLHGDIYQDFLSTFGNLKALASIHLYKNIGEDKILENRNIMSLLSSVKVDLI